MRLRKQIFPIDKERAHARTSVILAGKRDSRRGENRSAFHLYGKTSGNFPPNGTVHMGKTVVPLWNQMERFSSLVILGNEPRISPMSIVCECDGANGSVIFQSFR